jgi:DNA-binding NtrC family response regulator
MQPHILIVDDQEAIRLFLAATLDARGYRVSAAATGSEALAAVDEECPDLMLLDLRLPDMHGLDILEKTKDEHPDLCVVILTSFGKAEAAVEAMRRKAFDFVTKPVNLDHLLQVINRGLAAGESSRRRQRVDTVDDLFARLPGAVPSRSRAMAPVYEMVRKIAAGGRSTVLIQGESGVGKDILAQVIHLNSPRRDFPCLEINCASLPEQLLESELFGHERGAFTDASQQKLGLLELAHGGTLFLDEIAEMALPVQVKLLRVLEKMSFRRVGGLEDIQVDVRIVAASNHDLASLVARGGFRQDLYFRLKVVLVTLPPLRQRQEDIPDLARHFLRQYNEEFGKRFKDFSADALAALREQPWPGNVRQLRNTIERSVLLGEGNELDRDGLQLDQEDDGHGTEDLAVYRLIEKAFTEPWPADGIALDDMVRDLETVLIKKALQTCGGNQSQASRLLGLGRDRLRYRLKQYNL